ncbi:MULTISPECIES: TIGR02680 family protein [Actinosynnema]|uniref:TIGR02680 family protein n=1 Tax=Actinosynnema TaxID=40566 RepID=UPI0020A4273E|nr:TIGR02680 family protein [Actinosynnema pretiosum]MCP2099826.1 TIGR02680 family protein [Actinosynnema pretiosum]
MSDRWRLHRGGIVNIWQYAEQVFDFSGGRAIFQGTNGSGKSRTLELLLPLCLDGDLRQVGSKGFDTVSLRRLMLDDYDGGPNRIGYAWIELRRGEDEYLTCGLGVKASKTSQAITDSWRFITPLRVGRQLQLVGAERTPLGPAHLREAIGADCVLEEAAFRARVAEEVYGVPAARYGDLLHLQRTLRNPDVGLKVLEGQLEQILSDALPPLDQAMVEQLATSFDDLESIRENITRLSAADSALGTFLKTYSDYALGGLRSSAERLGAAEDGVRKLEREGARLTAALERTRAERADAERSQTALEAGELRAEEKIGALKELPAFRGLEDLRTRERLVEEKRSSARVALEVAAKQRAQEDGAVDGVLRLLRRLAEDLGTARELAEPLRGRLLAAGLELELPAVPSVVSAEAVVVRAESVRAEPDPEAEPRVIERRVPPAAPVVPLEAVEAVADRVAEVAAEAGRRGALVLALHQRSVELDSAARALGSLEGAVGDAERAASEAVARRDREAGELAEVGREWLAAVAAWRDVEPFAGIALRLPEAVDPARARGLAGKAREGARPAVSAAREAERGAADRVAGLRVAIDERDAELAGLRGGSERAPDAGRFTGGERDSSAGAPFYRLVDFREEVGEAERAGLEASLEASGLLDAWVPGDPALAVVGGARDEVFAVPGEAVVGASLADVLEPAVEPGSPVSAEVVGALLASVSLASPGSGAGAAVSADVGGGWRAGVLVGRWGKAAAEFIGAGAREGARRRRIGELEERLAGLREELGAAEVEAVAAREQVRRWESHLERFPADRDLVAKHGRLQAAQEGAERAGRRVGELEEELGRARARDAAARAEVVQEAATAGLVAETEALRQAQQAASDAQRTADRLGDVLRRQCGGTLADLADAAHRYRVAEQDRVAAEQDAEERCSDHAAQAATLSELADAVGGEAREVADQLAALEAGRRTTREDLREMREQVAEAREKAAKLEAQLEASGEQLAGAREGAERAEGQFLAAVRAPGVLVAALPEASAEWGAGEIREALAGIDRRGAGEATVITKLQALQTSLAGSHDIAAEQHAGLLTVTVTGEEGARPVALAARQVAVKLAEQRGFLDERYQTIFADYLIRDLAEWLRGQIAVAEDLCKRMNEVLGKARSSQGVHVKLAWKPSGALDEGTRDALALVRLPYAGRDPEQDATLRRVFTERIEQERDSQSGSYAEVLSRALDYRTWHQFTVTVADTGPDGGPRERRLRQLSSGETRLISYVTLFAAGAAFYDAVSGEFSPLRLVLLDEAFERLDDPTIARMLGLLVDLDMDWVITWPSGWGVSDRIPRMHIYDVLRPKNGRGVACTQTTWDGAGLDRVDP